MSPFSIVLMKPLVKVFLQGLQVAIYLLSESDLVELVQDGFVETVWGDLAFVLLWSMSLMAR